MNEEPILYLGLRKDKQEILYELILPVILMSTIGAFYWAIRGTGGYGGSSGAVYAGLGWALAWFFLSYEKGEKRSRPYSSGWIVLAITLGIGFGGTHGYGQFMSWIRGRFYLNSTDYVPIHPLVGFLWLFQCGLAWGGTAGIFIAWVGSKKPPELKTWILRFSFGIGGAIIGWLIATYIPGAVNPLYGSVNYSDCPSCERTFSTSQSSMALLGAYFGFLIFEILRKEWRGVVIALIMGIGWGLGFSIFAFWHFGSELSSLQLDWWKMWEMSIGFVGGATIALCYYLFNRPLEEDKIDLVIEQPYSQHRNAEVLLGVELTIAVALGWSIYNGIGGFIGKFGLEGFWSIIISIPFILICLFYFIKRYREVREEPFKNGDGKSNIDHPGKRFLIIHIILVILGYMVSYTIESGFGYVFRLGLYTILLTIGSVAFLLLLKKKNNF